MSVQKIYHIAATTDAHYMVLLAALVKSLERTVEQGSYIWFHIVEVEIPQELKHRLELSVDPNRVGINWVRPTAEAMQGFQFPVDWSTYPQNIYMRLLLPYLLDPAIEKVLYLDVDMIAFKSVSHIFETPLEHHIIAAVQDQRVLSFGNSWGGIRNYESLGLSANLPYFNTGLILIDTKKWRLFKVTKKVIDCINNYKRYANYPDQYGLNVVLAGNWKQLDSKWNYFSTGNEEQPFMLHFVGRKPIFRTYIGNSLYKDFFFGYLKDTCWRDVAPIGEFNRYKKKLSNVFSKLVKMIGKLNMVSYDKKNH